MISLTTLAAGTAGAFYMSGMRGMLGIPLYRDASIRHEPN